MEELGLAQQGVGRGQQQQQQLLEEVVAMLQQGATPEQLMQMGVPAELIDAAIEILNGQASAQTGMEPGLAAGTGVA